MIDFFVVQGRTGVYWLGASRDVVSGQDGRLHALGTCEMMNRMRPCEKVGFWFTNRMVLHPIKSHLIVRRTCEGV